MNTAVVSTPVATPIPTGPPSPPAAHVSDVAVYTAPGGDTGYIAPAGASYVAPPDGASGIGIFASHSA